MLKEICHVTSLSQYNSCPLMSNQDSWPIDPSNTYKWDLLNTVVNSQWPYDELVDWYNKNIKYDFKDAEMMKSIFEQARIMVALIKEKHKRVFQEWKMLYKYTDEYRVVGTPDIIYYDEERDLWCIRDWKFSTHSWYLNDEVVKYDMQRVTYALFVCNIFHVVKVEFSFWVFDKGTGKFWEKPEIVTYEYAKSCTDRVMKNYIESKERSEYPPQENKKCGMCSLKKSRDCPLWKTQISVSETDDFF